MKRYITAALTILFATISVSIAGPDKEAIMAKEKAAWQAFKDKSADDFKKVVDKDIRCVYPDGISNLSKELESMKNSDIKSFTISDFDAFSDEKDIMVATYTVKVDGMLDGKEASGIYNAGSVWKLENGKWLAIFHTNIKQVETAK
jgi:hypothetical protein